MGNGGSHAQGGGAGSAVARQPAHWHHSLPSDPVLKASHLKVLVIFVKCKQSIWESFYTSLFFFLRCFQTSIPILVLEVRIMVPFYSQVEPSVEEGLYPSHYLTKGIQYMYVLIIYLDINIYIYSYFNIYIFLFQNGVYRSKSISQDYETERPSRFSYLSNQRDPLHRSHTHLHLDQPEGINFNLPKFENYNILLQFANFIL